MTREVPGETSASKARPPSTLGRAGPRLWLVLVLLLVLAAALSLWLGMPGVSLEVALTEVASPDHTALMKLQLPRLLQGLAVGATLAIAGAALQALLRNPLADPYILGVSGGAALGSAVSALVVSLLGVALPMVGEPLGGFFGALLALAIVMSLGAERGRPSPLRMLLVGVVVNALAGAMLMVLAALGDPGTVQRTLVRLMGTLGADPSQPLMAWVPLLALVVALVVVLPASRGLDLLALGDEGAQTVGLDPERLRRRLLFWLSLPVGAVVAVAGLIGFVGLVVPHAVRLVLGPANRRLLPASAVVGAAFLVLADAFVSRLAPGLGTELPVGVVTALIGGPVFLLLLRGRLGGRA